MNESVDEMNRAKTIMRLASMLRVRSENAIPATFNYGGDRFSASMRRELPS